MNKKGTICLFDSLTGGHHKMYLQQYSTIFLKRFDQVIIISDEDNFWKTNENILFLKFKGKENIFSNPELNKIAKLKEIKKTLNGLKPEFIFFMYLDEVMPNPNNFYKKGIYIPWVYFKYFKYYKKVILRIPITGLLFESSIKYKVSEYIKFFRSFFHKSTIFSLYQELESENFRVLALPEISDSLTVTKTNSVFYEITIKHKNDYILLIGSLEKRKGLIQFLKLAENCPQLVFIVSGVIQWTTFNNEEIKFINKCLIKLPNLIKLFDLRPNDNEYNLMIKNAKFIFLGYQNFPKSSNLLHKGALFKTPLIVDVNSPWILSKTEKYDLGMVIDFSLDINSSLNKEIFNFDRNSCQFESYLKDHSQEILEFKILSI